MRDSHRRLPHQHPEGKWFFVTWHLHGSLPHALYPPREKLTSGTVRVDGSLSGHHASWADVFGSSVLGWHRGSLPASWRATRSLRTGRLRRHVQPCPCAAVAQNLAIKAYAVPQRSRSA